MVVTFRKSVVTFQRPSSLATATASAAIIAFVPSGLEQFISARWSEPALSCSSAGTSTAQPEARPTTAVDATNNETSFRILGSSPFRELSRIDAPHVPGRLHSVELQGGWRPAGRPPSRTGAGSPREAKLAGFSRTRATLK